MLPVNFALQHEEMLRTLNENLQAENLSSNQERQRPRNEGTVSEDNQPLDLSKPKYYTADNLKKKWVKLCKIYERNVSAKRFSDDENKSVKRRRTDHLDVENEDQSTDPLEEMRVNHISTESPRD